MTNSAAENAVTLEQAKRAIGRWGLLDAPVRSPKESLAVVTQVMANLHADTRAVRVLVQSMARELGALRLRIDHLEQEIAAFTAEEEAVTPLPQDLAAPRPPAFPPRPPPAGSRSLEDALPIIEPEEVFAPDMGPELRARLRELSNVIDSAFPQKGHP